MYFFTGQKQMIVDGGRGDGKRSKLDNFRKLIHQMNDESAITILIITITIPTTTTTSAAAAATTTTTTTATTTITITTSFCYNKNQRYRMWHHLCFFHFKRKISKTFGQVYNHPDTHQCKTDASR